MYAKLSPQAREILKSDDRNWMTKTLKLGEAEYLAVERYMSAKEAPQRQREREEARAVEQALSMMWAAVKNASPDDRWSDFERKWRQGQIEYRANGRTKWDRNEQRTLKHIYGQRIMVQEAR